MIPATGQLFGALGSHRQAMQLCYVIHVRASFTMALLARAQAQLQLPGYCWHWLLPKR